MYYMKFHRFLVRHNIYLLILILFIIFFIKWNFTIMNISSEYNNNYKFQNLKKPLSIETKDKNKKSLDVPKNFETQIKIKDSNRDRSKNSSLLNKINELAEINNEAENSLIKKKGNTIFLTIYIESQCPDTTNFIKRQLMPTFKNLKNIERINYTIVPFGKAKCDRRDDDFICECQHGEVECILNQLMNCIIDRLPHAKDNIPLIGCIQGESDADTALKNCLNGHSEYEWLLTCMNSKRGRFLHALAGKKTQKLGNEFNFVPWIVIDGKRVSDAFYALEENLCKRLNSPKPLRCEHFL